MIGDDEGDVEVAESGEPRGRAGAVYEIMFVVETSSIGAEIWSFVNVLRFMPDSPSFILRERDLVSAIALWCEVDLMLLVIVCV